MVLIGNDNKKRLSWPIAKIIELIPGRDGEIRTVRLKTQHGTVIRPVQRIFPLEVQAIANSDKELKEESISVKSTKPEKSENLKYWIAKVKKSLNCDSVWRRNLASRGDHQGDLGSLRENRPTNRRASSLSEFVNKIGRAEMRSEDGRVHLPIGRVVRLPLEERVARRNRHEDVQESIESWASSSGYQFVMRRRNCVVHLGVDRLVAFASRWFSVQNSK
ncbi:DUF5641 domain-containing protein [Trichonephila clavipes]|nr:DUF5641 domain-containing protein [Trichonephila clavipes]